jgi:hypothetical protein
MIKQNPLFWLPGFRALRPFKMIFAAFVYATFYSLVSFEEFVPMARIKPFVEPWSLYFFGLLVFVS